MLDALTSGARIVPPLSARIERWINADRVRTRLLACASWSYAAFAWLLLLILPAHVPATFHLDLAWQAILHYGATHHWQYGTDAVFTYGPLGFLHCTAQYFPGTCVAGIIYQLLFKTCYVGLIFHLCPRLPGRERLVFVLLNTLLPVVDDDAIYLLTITYTGLLFCGSGGSDRAWAFSSLVFVAIAALIKGTFLLYGGVMLAGVGVFLVRRRRWLDGCLLLAVYGGCLLGADRWFAGQKLVNLPGFLRISLEIIKGYSPAMSSRAPVEEWVPALAFYVAVQCQLTLLAWRSPARWEQRGTLFLLSSAGLLVAWKAGFTRADFAHEPIFFVYALALSTAARALFPSAEDLEPERALPSFKGALVLVLAALYWTRCTDRYSGNHYEPLDRVSANLAWLVHPRAQAAALNETAAVLADDLAMPRCRAVIGEATVDMFAYEQGLLIANQLNYSPPPVFHAYNAYTPRLVSLNTAYYRSSRAPQFVLYKPYAVDDRYPTLDNAGVLWELLCNYQPVLLEHGYLLLKRRLPGPAAAPALTPLLSGELPLGKALAVPAAPGAVWCELDLRPTLLGRLAGFFYQAPVCNLRVSTFDGSVPISYRLVPGEASAGFILTPTVGSASDYVRACSGRLADSQRVSSIAVVVDEASGWLVQPTVGYRLFTQRRMPSAASR